MAEETKVALKTLIRSNRPVKPEEPEIQEFYKEKIGDRSLKISPLPGRDISFESQKIGEKIRSDDRRDIQRKNQIKVFCADDVAHRITL